MKKHILIQFVILFFVVLVKGQSLNGTSWLLLSFDNLKTSTEKSVQDKIQATLSFEKDSLFNGKMCNGYMGIFKTGQENSLKMNPPSATKMYCVGISEIERDLFAFYSKAVRYKMAGDRLFIFTSDEYRLTFKKQ